MAGFVVTGFSVFENFDVGVNEFESNQVFIGVFSGVFSGVTCQRAGLGGHAASGAGNFQTQP
jgi:hypothetical protein